MYRAQGRFAHMEFSGHGMKLINFGTITASPKDFRRRGTVGGFGLALWESGTTRYNQNVIRQGGGDLGRLH